MTEALAAVPDLEIGLEQLWAVLDDTPSRISFIDRERRHRFANKDYAAMIGRPVSEIVGRTVAEILGPEEAESLRPYSDRALAGEQVAWEGWLTFPKGRQRYVHRIYKPHRDAQGTVVGYFVLARDTTEQKRIESEYRRLSLLLEEAIDSVPIGFAVFNSRERLAICNDAYAGLFGLEAQDLVGASFQDLGARALSLLKTIAGLPAEAARAEFGPGLGRLWKETHDAPVEVELTDGRWVLLSRHPTADGGFVFLRSDVTEIKAMQEAIRESSTRVRQVLEACPVPISMIRATDGRLLYESPAALQMLGVQPGEASTESVLDYYADPNDRDAYLAQVLARGAVEDYELQLKRADGSLFWASVSSRLIEFQGETVIVASAFDLTERHMVADQMDRQREALHQSEKLNALGGLLAGVAHELNNPLSVVVGQACFLRDSAPDSRIRERADQIAKAADRCARIVRTFLAMARQSEPERKQVSLTEVVDSALEITSYALRSADITLERSLPDDLPPVWGDVDQLSQVVMNLIVNAEQALADTVADRRLRIAIERDDAADLLRLTVEDNGPGIPDELQLKVFDPFFTTKEVGVGTGVGLSVSRGIVEAHDGQIMVRRGLGGGSAFVVTLPISTHDDAASSPATAAKDSGRQGRILVVDDETDVADMLGDVLALDGHSVTTAHSGNEALDLLANQSFDLILSDMRMPDVDGPGLHMKIKNAYPDMVDRMLFITGDSLGPGARGFLEGTGLPYLEKPVTPQELRRRVFEMLA